MALGLSLGMVVGYQIFARYIFGYVYPQGYAEGALIISVMSLFFVFRLVNVVIEMHWVARDRYTTFVRMRVGCGLASVILNILCIPLYGPE